jgi:hypothetical protein
VKPPDRFDRRRHSSARFDRTFPLLFALAAVVSIAVGVTLVWLVATGQMPWWVLLLVGR